MVHTKLVKMKVSPSTDTKMKNKNYMLHFIYIVFKILGLAPYKYTSKSKLHFRVSLFGTLHSLLNSIILLLFLWPVILYKIKYNDQSRLFITNLNVFSTGSVVITAVVLYITITINNSRMCKLINGLITLDREFNHLGIAIDNKPILKNLSKYIVFGFIYTVIIVVTDFLVTDKENELFLFAFWVSDIIAFVIDMVAILQFTCFLYFISHRYLNFYIFNHIADF